MSTPAQLMQLPQTELEAELTRVQDELDRRKAAREKGLCDFCGKKASEPACSQPERHKTMRVGLMPIVGAQNEDGTPYTETD